MFEHFLIPLGILYLLFMGMLFVYGINFFYVTYLASKHTPATPAALPPDRLPRVTVQLPMYNEMYVATRLVMAAVRLDYPAELLEIQVLDDSTDETVAILQKLVKQLQAQGVNIHFLHRIDRSGFKAGALAAGLEKASGDFVAIFDSDFVPRSDFLMKTVPLFADPRVAFVQTRWDHLNSEYSLLTRLQSIAIDAHFIVEQAARSSAGYWFNFNGTGGIWRKAAIVDAGGWKSDTLTEDLDLSYRSFLRGWKAAYLRNVTVPGELPASINAYRRQQERWARGSFECARKLLPQVWHAPIPLHVKLEATLHLAGYGVHLLLFALSLLYPVVVLLTRHYPGLMGLMGLAFLFNFTAIAPSVFFISAQRQLRRNWVKQLPTILFMTIMGCGMMVNTLRAALEVLFHRPSRFERTPKFGIEKRQDDWKNRQKYQIKVDPIIYVELALSLWNAGTAWLAFAAHNWGIAFYAVLFAAGLVFVASLSVVQTAGVMLRQLKPVHEGE
jgi:cellulose synthase/poly-beta-1,6-N-acetylglucosamine synthase-like glycosyltransferase